MLRYAAARRRYAAYIAAAIAMIDTRLRHAATLIYVTPTLIMLLAIELLPLPPLCAAAMPCRYASAGYAVIAYAVIFDCFTRRLLLTLLPFRHVLILLFTPIVAYCYAIRYFCLSLFI